MPGAIATARLLATRSAKAVGRAARLRRLPAGMVLSGLYAPSPRGRMAVGLRVASAPPSPGAVASDGFALPPASLTMGYLTDPITYLCHGRETADRLRALVRSYGCNLEDGALLEWGCATGRVLRHFAADAGACEVWGVDPDEDTIEWAKVHLSPPLRFVTCSTFPHLPFPDDMFSLVYGLSVMTHTRHFRDTWVMELRRVLRPGGVLVVTVNDETSVPGWRAGAQPEWWPASVAIDDARLSAPGVVFLEGGEWSQTHVFYRREHLVRDWGRYFETVDVMPDFCPATRQTAIVMRKK